MKWSTHQETHRNTLGVYLHTPGCIFPCFLCTNAPLELQCHFWCLHMYPMTSSEQKWHHLVVGHTLIYILSKSEVNWTGSSQDTAIFVSSPILIIWPPETWPQNQPHSSSSPSLPRPQLMPLLVHWQLGPHPSACPSTTGTQKDAYHSFSIFWHTLGSWLLLNCIMPDNEDHLWYVFAALGTKSLEMHAQWMPMGSKEEQKVTKVKASAFLDWIQQGMTHDVNTHVHLRELKDVVARLRGPPRSCCMHQDTDGLLQDDQWWAQAALLYCPCILPRGKAPWET